MHVSVVFKPYHVQVLADCHRYYTCPIKEVDGEWLFRFKNEWHKIDDYVNEYTYYNRSMMSD